MNARTFALVLTSPLLALMQVPPAPAAEPAPAVAGDLARLQGCWSGRAGARRELKVTLDVTGQVIQVRIVTPKGLTIRAQGELRIDETTTPRAVDWVKLRVAGQERFPDIPAIYELHGETLTICNGGPSGGRPSAFKPGDGVLADVLSFERADTSSVPQGGQP
jgi:uncharacterized protein (TIGR03067 family)